MIQHLASFVGGEGDNEVRNMALRCLDRAADRLNTMGVHVWTKRQEAYTWSSGDASAALPTDWFCAAGSAWRVAADGSGPTEVLWMDWGDFSSYDLTSEGSPKYISIRSDVYDGLIHYYPKVSAEAAGQILRVPYYAKIQRPSEAADLYLYDIAREALLTGGTAFMLQWRYAQNPNIWMPYFADFERQGYAARAASHLHFAEGTPVSFGIDDSLMPEW